MKRILAFLLVMIILTSLFGCSAPANTDPEFSGEELYDLLFDIQNKITLHLDMAEEELAKMQADYDKYDLNGGKSPVYRKADLSVAIETPEGEVYTFTIEEVGVRMKGNTSRTDFYSSDEGIYNIIHLKLSFQETFDDPTEYGNEAIVWDDAARAARKDRTFATLEKLDLRWNRCDDGTYLKEYFAYDIYRDNGVLAPLTNLASLTWAGNHMGVFTINEPIDEVFLARNLPQEALGGDLYKVGWAGNNNGSFTSIRSIGIEDEAVGEFYAYDLKTNKKTSKHHALISLIQDLNTSYLSKDDFAGMVDIDSFLPYCAVSYLLGNPDDMRNNYNNFYIYFRADNDKAMIIPYDFDRCLGITTHWNPTGTGVTDDDPFGKTLLATGDAQENPLILYSVAAGGYYVREYADILTKIVSSEKFSYESFASIYEIAYQNYNEETKPGKDFHNTSGLYLQFDLERTSDFASNGNISIREYLDAKLNTLDAYLARVDEYADAQPDVDVEANLDGIWYVRGTFTNWECSDKYRMTKTDSNWSFTISADRRITLKLYNSELNSWYGSECVSEDCSVDFETDHHTNIVLPAGSYCITINPVTEIINIEEIEA